MVLFLARHVPHISEQVMSEEALTIIVKNELEVRMYRALVIPLVVKLSRVMGTLVVNVVLVESLGVQELISITKASLGHGRITKNIP